MRYDMRVVLDFSEPSDEDAWNSIDDIVMGGVSGSQFRITPDGVGVFEGIVSLEQGGGFASVHATLTPMDLSGFDGLQILVRGDGKRYRLRLRTGTGSHDVGYQSAFGTQAGGEEWQSVQLPFERFQPRFHGRLVPDAPPLDTSAITSLGWVIGDGQAGAFRLEIDWVRAYAERAE